MIKRILSKFFLAIPVTLVLAGSMFSHSCANTTDAPTGGDKDTIPPVIKEITPLPGSVNVPVKGVTFRFTFNEFVTIKNAKNIFLSPPLKKAPKSRVKGKSVIVYFEEDLLPNTTYTIDFTDAIADNNEGNMYPGFTYVFSTGENIDSMMLTGTVQDFKSLTPQKGITVMLYKDHSDSAVLLHRPDAAVKTDEWGFFCLRNIKDTLYRLYAIKDEAGDNIYDPQTDFIGYSDTLVSPSGKVNDSIKELKKYEMTDTVNCLARHSDVEIRLFREKGAKQMINNKVRVDERTSYISFTAADAHVDSMWVRGFKPEEIITQFNIERDSLEIWINNRTKPIPDTLHVFVNYRKTDTSGILKPYIEHVKLAKEGANKLKKTYRKNIRHEDTICVYSLKAEPELVEQKGFSLEFKHPIIYEHFDSLVFMTVNPKQKEQKAEFELVPDSTNILRYSIMPKTRLLPGWEYYVKVPERAFRDINGYYCDSTITKVSLPKEETLSKLNLVLNDVEGHYIIDLLNEKRDKILRTYSVSSSGSVSFPYLRAGKYVVRITEDRNNNGIIDTGSLLEHRQPEKVLYYKRDGKIFIDIPESAELDQEVSLKKMFADEK